jgi:hypothetical protein
VKEFNFENFNINIQKDFEQAWSIENDLASYNWKVMEGIIEPVDYDYVYEDEKNFNQDKFITVLKDIKLKILFAYESLELSKMTTEFEKGMEEFEGKWRQLDYIGYVDVFYSQILSYFFRHFKTIISQTVSSDNSEFENTSTKLLLEQILKGTAKILTDRKIEPANEKEVRKEVYDILIHVFPDTVREIPIAKVSKTYKPDIGVKRIKSAIEYKFADSLEETKKALGGIFEDIQGYEGSADWTTYYAVIYMTDNYLTEFQIKEEFKLSKVPHNWIPIIIYGKGKRIKKTLPNTV